jgi:hypothetical protein
VSPSPIARGPVSDDGLPELQGRIVAELERRNKKCKTFQSSPVKFCNVRHDSITVMPQNEALPIMHLIFKFDDVRGYLQRGHRSTMRPQSGSNPAI